MPLTNVDLYRIDGTVGSVSNISTSALNGGPLAGARNRIINGDMRIDQRNAGASVTNAASRVYTVDRWASLGSASSKFSVQQNAGSVTPPAGYTNYLGVTSLAATTVGASDYYVLQHRIEGYNAADLAFGAAGASSVTISFWVRSSLTGTFSGSIQNSATDRSYPFSFAISSVNTWEQKTVTIAGDTSGTWLKDNGIGINLNFDLGSGSTFRSTAGAWAGSNLFGVSSSVQMVATNGATFYLTGVQLEAGTVATPFERRIYGQELALCQRYFERSYEPGTATGTVNAVSRAVVISYITTSVSSTAHNSIGFRVEKRATPTMNLYNYSSGASGSWATAVSTGTAPTSTLINLVGATSFEVNTTGSGMTVGAVSIAYGHWTASAEL